MLDVVAFVGAIFFFVASIWLIFALFQTVGDMAVKRGHNPWPWWLLSLSWSPFGSIIVMWLLFKPIDTSKADQFFESDL
jgi:uncharacterized membrane protein